MEGKVRGVFIAHTDFQGDTKDAVSNARDFAASVKKALQADFENEVREAQKKGQLDATEQVAALYASFERDYKIRVVKVDL
jgi:hypothetical protein